ncbi:MAG: acetyl-CoA carboxylase biotin carboxyl carrier protein [Deltaproteobacteria bacterium]|nr:acetyl-CoA carboxylase biotin carboxyl carrier protein [Deltaproteobacteria bacterium]
MGEVLESGFGANEKTVAPKPGDTKEGGTVTATELTLDEVLQILNLIEKSDVDFLQLEVGDLKLTLRRGGAEGALTGTQETLRPRGSSTASRPEISTEQKPAGREAQALTPEATAAAEGTVPILAPMVGTFYTTPEPGAPPFVQAGSRVDENTTVGLIEVMKVFNTVKAGVRGVIANVYVQSGQFVEYNQTLFLVKPDNPSFEGPSQ